MRNPGGVLICSGPDGVTEADTDRCNHCGCIVLFKAGQGRGDIGGTCKQCMGFVCDRCYARIGCLPFEERLKRAEARGEALRSYGLAS